MLIGQGLKSQVKARENAESLSTCKYRLYCKYIRFSPTLIDDVNPRRNNCQISIIRYVGVTLHSWNSSMVARILMISSSSILMKYLYAYLAFV